MFKFITRQHFIVNLLVALALFTGFIFFILWTLGIITRHGDYEKVPDISGKNFQEAIQILEAKGFSAEVLDSVWDEKAPRLSVIRQLPEADEMVKSHRQIYLTINRSQPPLVDVPNMVGLSFRNAELYLKQLGLRLGDTSRKPDIAKDAVLEQLYNGQPISPATRIFQGSTISFVLGSGIGSDQFEVPDLFGLTFREAKSVLSGLNLNIAAVIADRDVRDTLQGYVYRQNPENTTKQPDGFQQKNKIRAGQSVDLWLSNSKPERIIDVPPAEPADDNPDDNKKDDKKKDDNRGY